MTAKSKLSVKSKAKPKAKGKKTKIAKKPVMRHLNKQARHATKH